MYKLLDNEETGIFIYICRKEEGQFIFSTQKTNS